MPEKQHPVFIKYSRKWLSEVTGYSSGYISRLATGKMQVNRSFIERVCYHLKEPKEKLFLRGEP